MFNLHFNIIIFNTKKCFNFLLCTLLYLFLKKCCLQRMLYTCYVCKQFTHPLFILGRERRREWEKGFCLICMISQEKSSNTKKVSKNFFFNMIWYMWCIYIQECLIRMVYSLKREKNFYLYVYVTFLLPHWFLIFCNIKISTLFFLPFHLIFFICTLI